MVYIYLYIHITPLCANFNFVQSFHRDRVDCSGLIQSYLPLYSRSRIMNYKRYNNEGVRYRELYNVRAGVHAYVHACCMRVCMRVCMRMCMPV
jgi:hypothetical protein